jgi:hypothetical protein
MMFAFAYPIIAFLAAVAVLFFFKRKKKEIPRTIQYRVNGKLINNSLENYYLDVLEIPKSIKFIDNRIVEDYYRLSLSPEKKADIKAVKEKMAARQFLLDRIYYLCNRN